MDSGTTSALDGALVEVSAHLSTKDLKNIVGKGLRQSFDEVIDGPRTGRYCIEQLEKTEKTYIGTKVEIILRDKLELPRGHLLDNLICGHEVDTKFSLSGQWMIPSEAMNQLCLLISGNDNTGDFSVGLLRAVPEVLTSGENRDGKKSISSFGKSRIVWLLRNEKMPRNFLLGLDPSVRHHIMSQPSGMQRVRALFTNVVGEIIPRTAIEQVAQQKDPLRRARQMKEPLLAEGFQVLCSTYESDRAEFRRHGYGEVSGDVWLSLRLDIL